MKFSELPVICLFAVLNPKGSSQLFIKNGVVIFDYMERKPVKELLSPDTEVQRIHIK